MGDPPIVLKASSSPETKVVLPVGRYRIEAQIHDSAGAYSTFVIKHNFNSYLPTQSDYNATQVDSQLQFFTNLLDNARIAQILMADVGYHFYGALEIVFDVKM